MSSEDFSRGFDIDNPLWEHKPQAAKECAVGCDRLLVLEQPAPVMVIHPLSHVYTVQHFPITWFRNENLPTDNLDIDSNLLDDEWVERFETAAHFDIGQTSVLVPGCVDWEIHPITPPNPESLEPSTKNIQPSSTPNQTILPYPGGKGRYADWIIDHFPDTRTYVEPFCGSAAVFLHTDPSPDEILNDANSDIYTFLKVAKQHPHKLINFIEQIPYAREEYNRLINNWVAGKKPTDDVKRAGTFWAIQQMNAQGKLNQKAGFKTQPTYSMGRTFYNAKRHLESTIDRFADVTVENLDWANVITTYDTDRTLFYCDPPYPDNDAEYTDSIDHSRFAAVMQSIDGYFAISYEQIPDGFNTDELITVQNLNTRRRGGQKQETTEQLLLNYDPETNEKLSITSRFDSPSDAIDGTVASNSQQRLTDL